MVKLQLFQHMAILAESKTGDVHHVLGQPYDLEKMVHYCQTNKCMNVLDAVLYYSKSDNGIPLEWDEETNQVVEEVKKPEATKRSLEFDTNEASTPSKKKKHSSTPKSPVSKMIPNQKAVETLVDEMEVSTEESKEQTESSDSDDSGNTTHATKTDDGTPIADAATVTKVTKKYKEIPTFAAVNATNFVRNNCFRQAKFMNPQIERQFLQDLKEQLKFPDEKTFNDMINGLTYLIRETITARRSYVTKRVQALMRCKYFCFYSLIDKTILTHDFSDHFQRGSMPTLDHLDQFYKFDNDVKDFDVDEKVKESYYLFIKDFCTRVSKTFDTYLKTSIFDEDTATMNKLTISDEALTFWIIKTRYMNESEVAYKLEKLKDKPEELKEWKKEYKGIVRKKKHVRKEYSDEYKKIYFKIKEHRDNPKSKAFWDKLFFNRLFLKEKNFKEGDTEPTISLNINDVPLDSIPKEAV